MHLLMTGARVLLLALRAIAPAKVTAVSLTHDTL